MKKKNDNFNTKTVICLFGLFLSMGQLFADTYYVSVSGDDTYAGTATNTAWRTIQKAADSVVAGDTVYVKAGDYGNENVVMGTDGTSSAKIIFEGYQNTPGDDPDLGYEYGDSLDSAVMPLLAGTNRTAAAKNTAITLNSRSHLIVKNFQIQNYTHGVMGWSLQNSLIENVVVIDIGDTNHIYRGDGIKIGSLAYNNTIRGCVVVNACAEGIMVVGSSNIVESCSVYCDDDSSVEAAMDYYITVAAPDPYRGDCNVISNCYVERVGDLPHGGHGIHLKGNCESNLIIDCVSVNQAGTGFKVRHRSVKYNTFENCVARGEGPGTDAVGFGLCDGASSNTFRNCRSTDNRHGVRILDSPEDGTNSAASFNTFENCIFEGTVENCIYFYSGGRYAPSDAFENDFVNCTFYGGEALFKSNLTNYNNAMINCIVSGISNYLEAASVYELDFDFYYTDFWDNGFAPIAGNGNFSGDPLFVDASTGNFRLGIGSACIDAGSSTDAPTVDREGTPRPLDGNNDSSTEWDAGAYEYAHADVDEDLDGMSDRDEVIAGTSPLDGGDYPVVGNALTAAGKMVVIWDSILDRYYTVSTTTNLNSTWTNVPESAYIDLHGTGSAMSYTNTQGDAHRFFRIEIEK